MDLNRASTFITVVESGSLTAAAAKLRLPTSSVSRSVSRLEAELGVVLLERTSRKLSLTDAGRAYFDRAREAIAELERASALAIEVASEPRGLVRLAAPPPLAAPLATLLAPWSERYPHVRIAVTFAMRTAERVGDAADIAIAIGRLPDSPLVARRIGTAHQSLVASPRYLAVRGTPTTLDELAGHALLDAHRSDAWQLQGAEGSHAVPVAAHVAGDDFEFVLAAAIAGLGIALLPRITTRGARERGELVDVLPGWRVEAPMQIVTVEPRLLARRVALFRDHLAASLETGACRE